MRKLKLQMQITIDGYVARLNGALDWMQWEWDEKLQDHVSDLHKSVDLIIMGRKMSDEFIDHWQSVATDPNLGEDFVHKMVETPKIVFSKTLTEAKPSWKNTTIKGGDLSEIINDLKNLPGEDIIVYGGATFVSQLIQLNLIDELHLFVNPVAIGEGMDIFMGNTKLELIKAQSFECGIVEMEYKTS